MVKGGLWNDTFEQGVEFVKQSSSQGAKQIKSTFDPLKMIENAIGNTPQDKGMEKLEKGASQKPKHTPLDFKKLQNNYERQDQQQVESMKNRLFQLVRSGEEKAIQQNKQKVMETKQKENQEEQERQRRHQEALRQQQMSSTPQGKERKSIFSHKKKAQREQTEVKPASGKQ